MYKVINKYGKAITIKMGGKEAQVFEGETFANKICTRLNEDAKKPRWLVTKTNWKDNRPYIVDKTMNY